MNNYIEVIREAFLFFPLIAFLISIPFILLQYHKYGSISVLKSLIIYSFVLYLICAYFLVILPLPSIEEVQNLTTKTTQLIPFSFVIDFIKETSFNIKIPSTYVKTLSESCFYVPIYNIFLTLPFGMYLRYYFKCNLKQTCLYTFLLSLFFELTQLTGLYFIYPRGYRLFDVDDLMLNTLGGLLGYVIAKPFTKILPTREKINENAIEKGKIISGFRRTTTFILDLFILGIILLLTILFTKNKYIIILIIVLYYFLLPLFLKGSTLAEKFLNITVVDYNNKYSIMRLLLRRIMFTLIYIVIPILLFKIRINNNYFSIILRILTIILVLLFYFVSAMKYMFSKRNLLYEKLSKTKLISTIK